MVLFELHRKGFIIPIEIKVQDLLLFSGRGFG